jgi:hypothetical protein
MPMDSLPRDGLRQRPVEHHVADRDQVTWHGRRMLPAGRAASLGP